MADEQTQRAITSLRERHTRQALAAAERIQRNVDYLIKRLQLGQPPVGFDLLDDATEVSRRIAALEAVTEAEGIYAAEHQEKAGRS